VLKDKYLYNLITFNTFYIYNVYLNKLNCYLDTIKEDSFDGLLSSVLEWDPNGNERVGNAVKNIVTTTLFVIKEKQSD